MKLLDFKKDVSSETRLRRAYMAAQNGIRRELGKSGTFEEIFQLAILIASRACTGGNELSPEASKNNAAVFVQCLAAAMEASQHVKNQNQRFDA